MKLPLEKEPFAPVKLSRDQEAQLTWLRDAILDETLLEYDEYVYTHQRVLERTKWKHVMSRENISIYKRAGKGELGGHTPDICLDVGGAVEAKSIYWRVPSCVGVGTLTGSLEDLLYGMLATTMADTEVRTTYIKEYSADARVIANVINPSETDPLRSLLVRWSVVSQLVQKLGVAPRDVINMEGSGTRVLPNGERIGYVVMHSVDIPGCGELTDLGIIRTKFSSCYIFRDTGNGAVELFMRAFIEPGGSLGDSLAVFTMSLTLIAFWRLMIAGQNKKLAYMVRTMYGNLSCRDVFEQAQQDNATSCPLCQKALSAFRSSARCDLCLSRTCKRCIDKRKLTHVTTSGAIVRVTTRLCKACITTAANMRAWDVAVSEHVPDAVRTMLLDSSDTSSSGGPISRRSLSGFSPWAHFRDSVRQHRDTITSTSTFDARTSSSSDGVKSVAPSFDSDAFSFSSPTMRTSVDSIALPARQNEGSVAVDQDQFELWMRMNQLQVAAEETHLLTQQIAASLNAARAKTT